MPPKNARMLGLRLDSIDDQRLSNFETKTHIEGVSLARASLKAALSAFEREGVLSLPLHIISEIQMAEYESLKSKELFRSQSGNSAVDSDTDPLCADSATSRATSPLPTPPPETATIVKLPAPPVMSSLMHSTLAAETPPASSPAQQIPPRTEVVYKKRKRK